MVNKITLIHCIIFSLVFFTEVYSQETKNMLEIDFNSNQFQIYSGEVCEHAGRKAFKGVGAIKDFSLLNGIIEVDMFITGDRSYPSINFRVQSQNDYEHFYIRPHRSGLYPDALQYAPCINGIDSWQLYSGKGYTAIESFTKNKWFNVKIAIKNSQAKVYINNKSKPSLEIFELYHESREGDISLRCPLNNTAYFSNLRVQKLEDFEFDKKPFVQKPIGLFEDWEVSQAFGIMDVDFQKTPKQQNLENIKWEKIKADESGLVNFAKYTTRVTPATDLIYSRTNLNVEKDTIIEMLFGYSDAITIFLNGNKVFQGNSAYTSRDPSFLGIIGLNDALYLPLKKGNNELIFAVAESFGGWGFIAVNGQETYFEDGIKKTWELKSGFNIPESILWDKKREVLYVTNFDQINIGNPNVDQFISKISLTGEVIKTKWVDGLNNPLGMTIYEDKLYVCERNGIAIIDLESEKVLDRLHIKGAFFLNDIAIDNDGILYVSDSRKDCIWRVINGEVEEWLKGEEITDPNVLYFNEGRLFIGNSADNWVKVIEIEKNPAQIIKFARFPEGFIDGIRADGKGNMLVSMWKGKIYKVDAKGNLELIFHTENIGEYSADFEYISEKNLLIIPTFYANKVCAYYY